MYKKFISVITVFIAVNILAFIFKNYLHELGFAIKFLLIANLFLFALSLSGFAIQIKSLSSSNPHAFIRGIYASLLLKIFVVLIVVGTYLFITEGRINKPAFFTALGLYIVYTVIEVTQLMKISRTKTNA